LNPADSSGTGLNVLVVVVLVAVVEVLIPGVVGRVLPLLRAIYITLPKAVADQWGNCARPGLRDGSGYL